MNTAVNVNVVHESEAQRQHARVKLPAKLRFVGANREVHEERVVDLSAGGFSFSADSSDRLAMRMGDFHKGKLQFVIDNLSLAFDIEFQIRSVDQHNGRIGCQFQNMESRDIATMRTLITAHLSGELVNVGDLLSTLQRENFTKARKQKDGGSGMGAFARMRAFVVSVAVFIAGIAAFCFVVKSVYGMYFVTHATSGVVTMQGFDVTMPREGMVQSLVGPDGKVAKGAPLATFSASMLEMLKGHLDEDQLQPKAIEQLVGTQMKGTLTSPCDCTVGEQLVADGQYAAKGAVIFHMVPKNTEATIDARFTYRQFGEVHPGTKVNFQVAGQEETYSGTVVSTTSLKQVDLSSDFRATIKPDTPIDPALTGRPADVTSNRGPSLDWLVDKVMAAGR